MSAAAHWRGLVCALALAACVSPDRGDPATPAPDALLARFDAVIAQTLFDPRLLATPQWARFRLAFGERAREARDEAALQHAFRSARDEAGLFSHFDLQIGQSEYAAQIESADARADLEPIVTLERREHAIVFMRITSFFGKRISGQIDAAFSQAIDSGATSLIVDLRGNPGGTFAAWPVMDRLLDRPATLGALVAGAWYRTHEEAPSQADIAAAAPLTVPDRAALGADLAADGLLVLGILPRAPLFTGRVYVLIDGRTASTAEIVAAALQRQGRAVLVGEVTAGEVLNAELIPLQDNVSLLVPVADVLSPDGRSLEGVGVTPDVEASDALACAMALAQGAPNDACGE